MKTLKTSTLILAALMLWGAGAAMAAQTDHADLTINANVANQAALTLDQTSIHFADSDPDAVPSITDTEGAVTVTVKAKTGSTGTVTLTVVTDGDLTAGGETIATSNVTWEASGTGFVNGTMNKTTPQSAGSWTGSGKRTGTFTYKLANSWSYAAGSYTAKATYTLNAP
jgi:hypothetical protein